MEEPLVRGLFVVAAMRLALVSLVLLALVLHFFLRPAPEARVEQWHFQLIGATYGLSVLYLLLLRSRSLTRLLAYIQVGLDGLVVTALVLLTQGIESPFTFAYVFVVLAASMTLFRKGAILAAAACVGLFAVVAALQFMGWLAPVVPWSQSLLAIAGNGAGLVLVAFLSSTLAEKLQTTGRELAKREADLAELHELHAAILQSLPAGVLTLDDQGIIRFANEAASAILRRSAVGLFGVPLREAVPSMEDAWNAYLQVGAKQSRHEADHGFPDGDVRRLGFSVAPLTGPKELVGIVVFQDVTDIVRLKDAVARSERLASVGQFAAGLAHEVRNPLASMCASIDVLRATIRPPEPMQKLMANVTREAERLNRLITDFLVLARPRSLNYEDCDLSELVCNVLDMVETSSERGEVRVERKVQPAVVIPADSDLLRQVVWNLVKNGCEALREQGGRLSVEVWMEDHTPILRVSDDGPGVPPDQVSKIFSPFFTTKEGGSGLGLAITNSIVEAHGAHMEFESAVGEGTSVTIRFDREATKDLHLQSAALA